jgi:hypothetical protein
VGDVLKSVFGQLKKLEGRPMAIEVGYQAAYVKYVGKKDDGSSAYQIIDRDGNPVRDVELVAVEFPDADAAKAYAAEQNIQLGFANVLAYEKSAVAQQQQQQPVAATNW